MSRVLIAGESWITESTHYKGRDAFTSVTFETGVDAFRDALVGAKHDVVYLPGHEVPTGFPSTLEELERFDVVVLSDIGANSILLHPSTWLRSETFPNRLRLLAQWVTQRGGGLAMLGGYLSFQGFEGKACFRGTAVEDVLPAILDVGDDRVEEPEGVTAEVVEAAHPICAGIPDRWPVLLGYNRFTLKPDSTLIARIGPDPLLAVRQAGAGRTMAWASDIAPHWCPPAFMGWAGYPMLFGRAVAWLAGEL